MDADFSDIIANVGDGFSVGAQSVVADGDIAFVFDVVYLTNSFFS
jgi:hypothetical protein